MAELQLVRALRWGTACVWQGCLGGTLAARVWDRSSQRGIPGATAAPPLSVEVGRSQCHS